MCGEWVLYVDLDRCDGPGMIPAAGILDGDVIVGQKEHVAGVLFSVGVGYGGGHALALGVEETRLQVSGGVFSADACQISRGRVAGGASARAVEEYFTGVGVAGEQLVGRTLKGTACRPYVGCRDP